MENDPVRDSPPKGSFGPRLRAGAVSNGMKYVFFGGRESKFAQIVSDGLKNAGWQPLAEFRDAKATLDLEYLKSLKADFFIEPVCRQPVVNAYKISFYSSFFELLRHLLNQLPPYSPILKIRTNSQR